MNFLSFRQKLITRVSKTVFVFGKYFEVGVKDIDTIILTSIVNKNKNNPDLITFQIFNDRIIGVKKEKSIFVGLFNDLDNFDLEINEPIQDWIYSKA